MKSSIFNTASVFLFLLIGVLFFTGCEKEQIPFQTNKTISDESDVVSILNADSTNRNISVVTSEKYGTYLHISSREEAEFIAEFLDQLNKQQLAIWEAHFGDEFVSMREYQSEHDIIDAYPDYSMGTLYNPAGYIMVDNVLYRDDYRNDKHYIVNDDGSEIFYDVHDSEKGKTTLRSSCYRADDIDTPCHEATRCGNGKCSLLLFAEIDHIQPLFGNEKLYLRSRMQISPCNSSGQSTITANHHIYITYSIVIDGIGQSGSSVYYGPSYTNNFNVLLAQGNDVCINYVNGNHQSSCPYGSITAYTSV